LVASYFLPNSRTVVFFDYLSAGQLFIDLYSKCQHQLGK